jgi:hypothetical protein
MSNNPHFINIYKTHIHIPYTWSDVILCIVWRHKSRLCLIWLKSVQFFVYFFFLYRSSYRSYSIHEKYDMKTDIKSEMHNLGYTHFNCGVKLFHGFYTQFQNVLRVIALSATGGVNDVRHWRTDKLQSHNAVREKGRVKFVVFDSSNNQTKLY